MDKTRFSDYAVDLFSHIYSRKRVKNAIKSGNLLLNGEPAETGRWVKTGDRIDLVDHEKKAPKSYNMEIDVVYEDDHLAVVHKPAGIVVNGNRFRTLENALQENMKKSPLEDALQWPRPVHRLDSSTSGLLLVAKTARASTDLGRQFAERTIHKIYRAVVVGTMPQQGVIDESIDNQSAVTAYTLIKTVPSLRNESLSLVELYPETGRTHQLRIHLSRAGHPIMGDRIYGREGKTLLHKGLFLAAVGLGFTHPVTREQLAIRVNEPGKFNSLLEREEKRWRKYTV